MKKIKLLPILLATMLTGCTSAPKTAEAPLETDKGVPAAATTGIEGWGFRRMEGARPEFTEKQIKDMDTYDCIYMGKEDEGIYLTFDEGYEAGYTASILDTLKEKGVPAAFFITGDYLAKEPELVKRMVEEGHIVGNHTENHPSLPTVTDDAKVRAELTTLADGFRALTGQEMKYFRAPKGEYNTRTLALVKDMGYRDVFWSFAYQDWEQGKTRGKAYAARKVTEGLHGGIVILLHAVSSDNAEALGDIIDAARAKGLIFRSLDEYVPMGI